MKQLLNFAESLAIWSRAYELNAEGRLLGYDFAEDEKRLERRVVVCDENGNKVTGEITPESVRSILSNLNEAELQIVIETCMYKCRDRMDQIDGHIDWLESKHKEQVENE